MWKIKEEDLEQFRITCKRRLSPEGATGFMLGTIIFDSLVMFFIILALTKTGWAFYSKPFEKVIVSMELVLYSLQLIFLILYLFPKARFKFQKLQALVVLLYAFQLGTIGWTVFILPGMSDYSINSNTLIFVSLLLLGAVVYHIVTTIDTFKQASKGAFSMDERATSFFSETKLNVLKGTVIYVLSLLILIYVNSSYSLDTMFGYLIFTVIMYAVAIGAAEFQLLAYCRFKFPSFYISWEEHEIERQKRVKLYEEKEKREARK
ncbi:hypothetical protein [Bacillus toyonensis]|uniref:hypothetical protein n=1 Tax=Bacillus toyonensis TaxID=155322 RepID=UPI00156E106E|nr:hypothetical protein [Bacillus toyonensis]NSL65491.1 hypothetical protein [Bacillus toyonensis]